MRSPRRNSVPFVTFAGVEAGWAQAVQAATVTFRCPLCVFGDGVTPSALTSAWVQGANGVSVPPVQPGQPHAVPAHVAPLLDAIAAASAAHQQADAADPSAHWLGALLETASDHAAAAILDSLLGVRE